MKRIRAIGRIRAGERVTIVPQRVDDRVILVNIRRLNRWYALTHIDLTAAQRAILEADADLDAREMRGKICR